MERRRRRSYIVAAIVTSGILALRVTLPEPIGEGLLLFSFIPAILVAALVGGRMRFFFAAGLSLFAGFFISRSRVPRGRVFWNWWSSGRQCF